MEKRSRARILRKNVHYPTYQLFAVANSSQETPERQLVIGALTVLEWVRTKFREFEIPEEFKMPGADNCEGVQICDLKSKRIDVGYRVETVCVPEEKVWAFSLAEPDLSSGWKEGVEVSTAVPGRIFETNIAFRVVGSSMQCGVNVMISEPEGTEASCRVLRPAVVQRLAVDPRIKLFNGYLLEETLVKLSSKEKIKNLRNYLDSALLPAVVFCDLNEKQEEPLPAQMKLPPLTPPDFSAPPLFGQPPMLPGLGCPPMPMPNPSQRKPAKAAKETSRIPYDSEISRFLGAQLGSVHSFRLPASQFENFQTMFSLNVEPGDVFFLEPKELGGDSRCFHYSEEEQEDQFYAIMDLSRDFLRKKSVRFGKVAFVTDARLLQLEQFKKENRSIEETIELYEDKIKLLQDKHEEELMRRDEQLEQQATKVDRLNVSLKEAKEWAAQERDEAKENLAEVRAQFDWAQEQVNYFKSWRSRPKTPQEVPQWAEQLADRLVLHSRAVKMLQGLSPNTIDMQMLCDALEYLANEYRDQKSRLITRDEADARSSEKYDRSFKVVPSGETTINRYPKEYTVDYDDANRALNEHLKVGNTAPFLIRIYFFYDSKNQKIVVGSLPEHLPTVKFANG